MEKYLLRVNLTTRKVTEELIPGEILHRYIGGKGLAAYYSYKEIEPGIDPLDPANRLMFFIGPLTGLLNAYSRHVVVGKSPLTNTFSDSYAGGWFGAELSKTKYMGILLEGKSDHLAYLRVTDEGVLLEDARHLAGKSTYEVDATFKDYRVASIGPAGEKLIRFACIINDASRRQRAGVAGRGGLGAVMGSKNLKAIIVRGKRGPESSLSEKERARVKELQNIFVDYLKTEVVPGIGLGGNLSVMKVCAESKILPVRNFREGSIEGYERVSEDALREITVGKSTCYLCPVACGVRIKIKRGPYEGLDLERIEYETVALNGPNCGQLDLGAIAKINRLCNEYGMDTISIGSIIGFMMECSEKGLIDHKLNYGDAEGQINLLEMIGQRKGIGALLGEGLTRAAEHLGLKDYAVQIKGLEIPGYDVRGPVGMALAYTTADRGGDHLRAWTVAAEREEPFTLPGKAKLTKYLQDRNSALWCLIGCDNMPANTIDDPERFVDLSIESLNALGWDLTKEQFLKTGERIYNLTRLFNVREGFHRKDDQLPTRFLERREDTGWQITQTDFDRLLDEYYSLRGWDGDGRPIRETLNRLEIMTE